MSLLNFLFLCLFASISFCQIVTSASSESHIPDMQEHTKKRNDSHVFAETLRVTPATTFAYFLHKNEAYNAQTGKKHVSPKEDSPFIVPS